MKKKRHFFLIGLNLLCFSSISEAENLLQVYRQAKSSNPDLRSAAAERDIAYEKINESRSSLLPQIGLSGLYGYQEGLRSNTNLKSNKATASLQLRQTLFNMSKWREMTSNQKSAGIQEVDFQVKEQKLLLSTATAYFNVLRTIDILSFTESRKTAIYRKLDETTQRLNVGLVAITDVQNARADYDMILADEVKARNELDNALEALREISGGDYASLSTVNVDRLKVSRPEPVNQLVKEAEQKNLELLVARLSQDFARHQIKLAQAGHMPTLNLNASSEFSNIYKRKGPSSEKSYNGENSVSINLDIPLYQGGFTHSKVEQAQHNFVRLSEKLVSKKREVFKNLRSSFNNISAAISGINAYQQAVVSAKSSLNSMEAGYNVGTRTILDVLKSTYELYDAKQKLSNARYDYLINTLNIKYSLGTLNESDLASINNLLEKSVSTSATTLAPEVSTLTKKRKF
ncbi:MULTISPECIES: outer membrane channel protein TolC [Candidatus Williamhamiltonella]|uniref:Outer membrane protein TolC n=1 Tax=Candidatus Williamhamiltonella defendens TaxID=138072 RepID=A0A2D3TEA3_9ENTR|nr:outer membrane channel protein TolC [Candidatus Hamiltonella defensa]ATW34142.1 outer membrane channel protein TolC [Candidatus Hamiltonella defensa]AYB48502.1 outer membrane channel protein TolC [Candidatus Hamiltonella defensa]